MMTELEKYLLPVWDFESKRGEKKHVIFEWEYMTAKEYGLDPEEYDQFQSYSWDEAEWAENCLLQFFDNLEKQFSKRAEKKGQSVGGYIAKSFITSGWGVGKVGYKVVEKLADIVPVDEITEMYTEQTKGGKILHVIAVNHDGVRNITIKALNFELDSEYIEIHKRLNKFIPTPIILDDSLANFPDECFF